MFCAHKRNKYLFVARVSSDSDFYLSLVNGIIPQHLFENLSIREIDSDQEIDK